MERSSIVGLAVIALLAGAFVAWYYSAGQNMQSSANKMTFFVTSVNPGEGGNLRGVAGADNYCQTLAASAGAGGKTWRAYLSTQASEGVAVINARDRIGTGPWVNGNGVIIANNVEELHASNMINKQAALTEKGGVVNGRGDTPNWHDILTGSGPDGRAIATSTDVTCGNWTTSASGSAMVGHHDRMGTSDTEQARSWNSSHLTRGCSLAELATTGSGGLLYCFAATE
ncbi:MAG: hypothetical protein Q7S05_01380 [bacterium]|nr:hypothetical protein [bacterium]